MSITHISTSMVVAHVSLKTRNLFPRIPSHSYKGSETHNTPPDQAPMPRYLAPMNASSICFTPQSSVTL